MAGQFRRRGAGSQPARASQARSSASEARQRRAPRASGDRRSAVAAAMSACATKRNTRCPRKM